MKAAALATGVAEDRLRTWERRYGVPSPDRTESGRRSYSEQDLALIRRMRSLVDAGIPAAHAAETVLTEGARSPREPVETVPRRPAHAAVSKLIEAAAAFDRAAFIGALDELPNERGWTQALDAAVMPFLREVGEAWESGDLEIAHEHFASALVETRLMAVLAGHEARTKPSALLACPEDERHDLPLLGLAVALAERGVGSIHLGPDVPREQIVLAARDAGLPAVCLIGTTAAARPSLAGTARALVRDRYGGKLFVGGAAVANGGPGADVIPGVRLPASFAVAAETVARALGIES